jgi:hypothetical protein
VAGGWPSTTSGCATPTKVEFAAYHQDLYLADFDAGTTEYIQWSVVMPSDWDGGTVTAQFYWLADTTEAGYVDWGFQGRSYGDGEAIAQDWGTARYVTDINTGHEQLNISSTTAAVTLAGTPAAGEMVQFRGFRDAGGVYGGDTLSVDARLIMVRVTFTRT